jgi:hypothetical protein
MNHVLDQSDLRVVGDDGAVVNVETDEGDESLVVLDVEAQVSVCGFVAVGA